MKVTLSVRVNAKVSEMFVCQIIHKHTHIHIYYNTIPARKSFGTVAERIAMSYDRALRKHLIHLGLSSVAFPKNGTDWAVGWLVARMTAKRVH